MIEKWCAKTWFTGSISRHDFERETNQFLIDKRGRRTAKESSGEKYFNTFEEAKAYLVTYGKTQIEGKAKQLRQAEYNLAMYEALEKPE